jgi:hypothetical protein
MAEICYTEVEYIVNLHNNYCGRIWSVKKISLILAVVSILVFILSSCSGGGKEPDASTTEDVVTTESPTTAAVTTQNVSHPQEPKEPEPIYVGMKYSEYQEACKKMKNSYKAFFELFGCAYWIDENGNNVDLPGKLLGEIAEKYADRKGGYTRIIKLGKRKGDAAEVVILQLV